VIGHFNDVIGDLRNGGASRLTKFIKTGTYRLVVIDTFSRAINGDQKDVGEMTQWLSPLQEISHTQNCALLLIDHHRKASGLDKDVVGDILGSTAKGAMADTILGLYRDRGKLGAKLSVTGREVEENTFSLQFDKLTYCWESEGKADGLKMTERRQELVDAVKELSPSRLKDIAEKVGQAESNTHSRLQELVNDNKLKREEKDGEILYDSA
jgi:RecA-family ATPase